MSRTLTAAMAAHLAGRAHTRCTMLLLALRDGTTLGVTDHDKDISYDLTDAGLGLVTYRADTGILASDIALSASMDADNYEVTGPIGEVVTLEAILGGRYDRATAWLFEVDWQAPSAGLVRIMKGSVSEIRPEGGRFVLEIRSDFDRFNQTLLNVITNQCRWDFGDANCTVVPEQIAGTVTAVASPLEFTVAFTGSYANDYFNWGKVEWTSGDLLGTLPMEVFDWTAAGVVTLFAPLAEEPAVGDTCTIKRGCSKARLHADATVPTCLTYANVVNFGGYPEVPGSDQALRPAIPGQGNG